MNSELRNLTLEEFKKSIPDDSKKEMERLSMPVEWAYKEFLDLIRFDDYDLKEGIRQVIIGYLDELMINADGKYEYL